MKCPTVVLGALAGVLAGAVGDRSLYAGDLPERRFLPGEDVNGAVDFAGDVDELAFPALPGMKFSARAARGSARLVIHDRADRRLGDSDGRGSATARIPEAGEYRLDVQGVGTSAGGYEVVTGATFPRTARPRKATLRARDSAHRAAGPGPTAEIEIDMLEGATLYAIARPAKGTPVVGMALHQPDGTRVDLSSETFTTGRRRTHLGGHRVAQSGRYRLELNGFARHGQAVRVEVIPWQPTAGTLDHVESLLPPDQAPVVEPTTYRLDPGLQIGPDGLPVTISTPIQQAPDDGTGVVLNGLRPDYSQVCFLSAPPPAAPTGFRNGAEPEPYAPFVCRPADHDDEAVVIDADRIALGVVALHPWVTRISAVQREAYLDLAPGAPSFEYLVAAVREALASDPLRLSDATRFPEVFKAAGKVAHETLTQMWGDAFAAQANGDPVLGLTLEGGNVGLAGFLDPRTLFYGVRTDGGWRGLAPPVAPHLTAYPPAAPVPGALGVWLPPGATEFRAEAIRPGAVDLTTPGGIGTAANGLHALYSLFFQVSPWPAPVDADELAGMTTEYLLRSGEVPNGAAVLEHLGAAFALDDPAAMLDELAVALDQHWGQIATWVWQGWPGDPGAPCHCGAAKFLAGYIVVNAPRDAAPAIHDLVRLRGEGELAFTATRAGTTVTVADPTPFSFVPEFTAAPDDGVVGEPMTFDPAGTLFSETPPAAPAYVWTFHDDPALPPTVVDAGTSAAPVDFTFTTTGFHLVTLDVTVGTTTQRDFRFVYVAAFLNLGFEDGTTSDWTVETHWWTDPTPGSGPYLSAIVGPGTDPIAAALPTVFSGNWALRINDAGGSEHISAATRTVHVPAGGTILKFAWAAVLDDPGHDPDEQPFFDIRVIDATDGGTVLYAIHHYANEPGYPWQNADPWGNRLFVPWQPVTLDLTNLGGHDVTISAIGGDCSQGGHGGYVYLDAP